MDITELNPFVDAMDSLAKRKVLPTVLDTDGLRKLGNGFHRQNFTSAQTAEKDLLDQYFSDIGSIVNPTTTQRADRVTAENPEGNVTVGMDASTARLRAKQMLRDKGYQPEVGKRGTLQDLSSNARINLVIKTGKETSQGAGQYIQGNDLDVLDAFPCWELVRFEGHKKQRDWEARWRTAARVSGDTDALRVLEETGRMVARKDSPIWDSLGDSSIFPDGLDNPYAPFAFNSGMGQIAVSYDDAKDLGLVDLNTKIEPQIIDLETIFERAA